MRRLPALGVAAPQLTSLARDRLARGVQGTVAWSKVGVKPA